MTQTIPLPSSARFGHLDIAYDERVLQPRPWTAHQSRWAADLLGSAPSGAVLELCAGAGQIGLLGLALLPDSGRRLVAVDLDDVACGYARANAAAAGLADRVDVRQGHLADVIDPAERFALVVADPPWVPSAGTDAFPEDPLLAIDGGDDGLDVARACVGVAARHLLPGGSALLQLGTPEQVERLAVVLPALSDGRLDLDDARTYNGGVLVHLRR